MEEPPSSVTKEGPKAPSSTKAKQGPSGEGTMTPASPSRPTADPDTKEVEEAVFEAPPTGCDADAIKLFVGNIPKWCWEGHMQPLFESVGKVVLLIIVRDKETRESKGSAFLWYAKRVHAEMAIKQFHNRHTMPDETGHKRGPPIVVRRANPRKAAAPPAPSTSDDASAAGPRAAAATAVSTADSAARRTPRMLPAPPPPLPVTPAVNGSSRQASQATGPGPHSYATSRTSSLDTQETDQPVTSAFSPPSPRMSIPSPGGQSKLQQLFGRMAMTGLIAPPAGSSGASSMQCSDVQGQPGMPLQWAQPGLIGNPAASPFMGGLNPHEGLLGDTFMRRPPDQDRPAGSVGPFGNLSLPDGLAAAQRAVSGSIIGGGLADRRPTSSAPGQCQDWAGPRAFAPDGHRAAGELPAFSRSISSTLSGIDLSAANDSMEGRAQHASGGGAGGCAPVVMFIDQQQLNSSSPHLVMVMTLSGALVTIIPFAQGVYCLSISGSQEQMQGARGMLMALLGNV